MEPMSSSPTCPLCGTLRVSGATTCSHCGLESKPSAVRPARPASQWYHNFWIVLAMILFVLGPLALPMVWKNPTLSRGTQWVLTFFALAYTVILVVVTMRIVQAAMGEFGQINSLFAY
ncbi:MAG: hypothetical protein HY352_03365 [Candidatus Omnitrophica bacterium]|nr:hypothetical protein [Candidatus Omnitrophota bacterium]